MTRRTASSLKEKPQKFKLKKQTIRDLKGHRAAIIKGGVGTKERTCFVSTNIREGG